MGTAVSKQSGTNSRQGSPSYKEHMNSDDALVQRLEEQDREIKRLRSENTNLNAVVENLNQELRNLSLQIDVASTNQNNINPSQPSVPLPVPPKRNVGENNLPMIGDHVVSMWGESKWQYFTATIKHFDEENLQYEIAWDDGDPTGTTIDYFNLAVDQVPDIDQVGVGSNVLFHQGTYKQDRVHGVNRSGGLRWHQGEITKTYMKNGVKLYDGVHTKTEKDKKWCGFEGFSAHFQSYKIEDFRVPPNIYDIVSSLEKAKVVNTENELDVFISYAKINCPSAIASNIDLRNNMPPSYEEAIFQNMCDPRDIAKRLREMGVRVFTLENDEDPLKVVEALKKVKVFIACLSDEYASNDNCRMEFQYAKKTLRLPVIPLVVGTGSFNWQLTVVGMLIAGELYIHFKSKDVEQSKITELARSIKKKIPGITITNVKHAAINQGRTTLHNDPNLAVTGRPIVTGKADIFFSYCWLNSANAKQLDEVSECIGNKWSDPRAMVKKISASVGLTAWLDIERLESAAEGMGMFGQIAAGLSNCKVAIMCISNEYSKSDNATMEMHFAIKSLNKPVIAAIVGKGDQWKQTVVGILLQNRIPVVNFQNIQNASEMEGRVLEISNLIRQIKGLSGLASVRKFSRIWQASQRLTNPLNYIDAGDESINDIEREEEAPEPDTVFKAPVPGDHVICLHQKWAYFLATIDSFDDANLEYTVNWDDKDPTGRVHSYKDVALNETPTADIGVGSLVLFPQGAYSGTEGNNTAGARYHQGRITKVYKDNDGVLRYDGEHTKGEVDDKWVTYQGFEKTFTGKPAVDLRLSPNAMDALMACRKVYEIN